MPRGRPRKIRAEAPEAIKAPRAPRVYKSPCDIVLMMQDYQTRAAGKNRGLFEDCKADIYRLWLVDYNDWQIREIKATGTSDRVYQEWERKFQRAFGELEAERAA